MKPAPGQYWRSLREPDYEDGIPKGSLVLITSIDEDGVHYACGEHGFSWQEEEDEDDPFEGAYEFVPDGPEQKAKQLADLLVEIQTMTPDVPKALPLAQDGFAVNETSLTLAGSLKPAEARRAVAAARNSALKFKKAMEVKQEELLALVAEQKYALEAKVDSLNKMVEIASEAIWTIELYLGRHEKIKQLRGGKAAPKDEKIVVRQLVLNMDEECAVAAEHGGIDTHEVHEFDAWVKKPKNLQQVLPEVKGVVAFHVRGERKHQGDPDAVSETYFLIRNGERLYRIQTNLTVGDVLFPKIEEFQDFFFSFSRDWDTNEELKTPLHPGTPRYMNAMKRADKRKRHYLRIILFMQGLIDRTKVFKPLPSPVINLCDPKQHEEFLRLVRDAEMVLTDGHVRFHEWLREINSHMEIGMRVIGEFHSYDVGARDLEYRSHPRGLKPDSHALYTVERKESGSCVVLFSYSRWSGNPSQKRASFRIHKSDGFVINFDLVTLADINFYMSNRLDRSNYTQMFPLLKCVRRLKRKEAKEEAPFKKLLTGEIVKAHGVTVEQAVARVDDLVRWWKYKNKIHRALKSDDAKVVRMIVREFRLERERAQALKEQAALVDPVVAALRKAAKDAVYVGHQRGTQYVTIAPMNGDNLFVCEQVWRLSKRSGSIEEIACREWALLDKRSERWQKLWSTDRWPKFKIDVRRENVLSDPEIEQAIEWGFKWARDDSEKDARNDRMFGRRDKLRTMKYFRFYRLAATWHPDQHELLLYYSPFKAVFPSAKNILTERGQTAPLWYMSLKWERKKGALRFMYPNEHEIDAKVSDPPWVYRKKKHNYHQNADECTRLVRTWQENIEVLVKEEVTYRDAGKGRARLKRIVSRARHAVEVRMHEDMIEVEHAKFREDLKDESLWEDHLKEKQDKHDLREPNMHELEDPLGAIVEQGLKLGGKSLAWAIKTAKRLKHPLKTDEKLPKAFRFPKKVDVDPPKEKGDFAEVPDELDDDEEWEEE